MHQEQPPVGIPQQRYMNQPVGRRQRALAYTQCLELLCFGRTAEDYRQTTRQDVEAIPNQRIKMSG